MHATGDSPLTLRRAAAFWLKLGCISFGGPAGQIAVMHQELVERRRWIDESRFLHALNYCMMLPGPEATQLAVYVGWLLHGVPGGLVAGILFVLPGALVMLALSWIYVAFGQVPVVDGLFYGLRAAVIALVLAALLRIGERALDSGRKRAIAGLAFAAIFVFGAPFPWVVLGSAAAGLVALPAAKAARASAESPAPVRSKRQQLRRTLRTLALGLAIWLAPLAGLAAWRGATDVLTQEAILFAKAALLTFGGAYAGLAYLQQEAVLHFGWISAPQMLDGLGLAETTPGPLILVMQFVGFLAAWRHAGGSLAPFAAGALDAAVTLWATFAPCFVWIFAGAPWIERLRGNRRLDAALSGITAAVVGVILSLALTLAGHTFWNAADSITAFGHAILVPRWSTIDAGAVGIAGCAFIALWRLRWPLVPVILASAAIGLLKRSL